MNLSLKLSVDDWYIPLYGCPVSTVKIYETPDAVRLATLMQPHVRGHVNTEPTTQDIVIRGTHSNWHANARGAH